MRKIGIIVCIAVKTFLNAQTQLVIPDTLGGVNFTLNMHQDSVQFFSTGKISHTLGYNQYSYLGPTLIFNKGNQVNITVNNQIGDTTSLHWHGLHVPAKWDGGPHTPILPSESWNPQFTIMDNASTYWYHPHWHKKTAAQAIKGAAGFIIVRDSVEAKLDLPRKYGIDDFPVVVQMQQYDNNNQAMPLGMQDSILLVNGARANYGYSVEASFPAQVVRLRLLNGSGERTFNFGFSGNKQFFQIASDGGLLDKPNETTRIRLSPGERAEILLDLTGMNGQQIDLKSYASELAMGIQGGPTMPMEGGVPMDSPLNGVDFSIFKINIGQQSNQPVTIIPSKLVTNTPYSKNDASITRTIRFTADNMMVMDGPFYFNDSTFDMMRIDYSIPLNSIEVWKLVNTNMVAHPFHIHDVQFYLLERNNGELPTPSESGRKDVILVSPGDSLMFITKFTDFADDEIPYMFHCHILMHEDAGMMGQFLVTQPTNEITKIGILNSEIVVYPNPANEQINLDFRTNSEVSMIKVYDLQGRVVFQEKINAYKATINTSNWLTGLYTIEIQQGESRVYSKVSVQ